LLGLRFEIRCKGLLFPKPESVIKCLLSFISRFLSLIHGYVIGN